MFSRLSALYRLLNKDQQRALLGLQILVILMSLLEVVSVLSIGPFMALVGDRELLEGQGILVDVYHWSGLTSHRSFLIAMASVALAALSASALLSMLTIWCLSMYGAKVGAELGNRLFQYYIARPWLFHTVTNSNQLTNKIAIECQRVADGVIGSFMQMNAKLCIAVFMTGAIFIYNPIIAMSGVIVFGAAYIGIYKALKNILVNSGHTVSEQQALRFKLMGEGFGGIKDTLLLGRQQVFSDRFSLASLVYARALGRAQVVGNVPRYAMELLCFGAVIGLVLYLLVSFDGDLGVILPVLSVYALAGFKLLPALQAVYSSVSRIKANLPSLENVYGDLHSSTEATSESTPRGTKAITGREFHVRLTDIVFSYPESEIPAIGGLSLDFPPHKVIGIVGASGSGKSTLIDILVGLIQPDEGVITINDEILSDHNIRVWQDNVGLVSQTVFLADTSIKENIAFGIPEEEIDQDQILRVVAMAHLDELIATLPQGVETVVGERGVQLSGGQRQRIAIARALYNDAEVLIFDEATSALDSITEALVMEAIHEFSGKKTVVLIAHRLTTVKQCDCIYLLEGGLIEDKGSYFELLERNPRFKKMADT